MLLRAACLCLYLGSVTAAMLSSANEYVSINEDAFMTQGKHLATGNSALGKTNSARDVVICRGIGDMNEEQFKELSVVWDRYASEKIITATSALLYKINDDGSFGHFEDGRGWDFELLTKKYLSPKGTKALPHVWCDASCCKNCNLPQALVQAMKRKHAFFAESVKAALNFGWHGYSLDFEGNTGNQRDLTDFFNEWASELARHRGPTGEPLELHLWTGSGAEQQTLSNVMTSVIDMSNYYNGWFSDSAQSMGGDGRLNWRSLRALALLQTDGKSSICPASNRKQETVDHSLVQIHDLVKANESVDANTRLADIDKEIDTFCQQYKRNCAFGLITYDLPGAGLECHDVLRLGHKAARANVQSLWIWSGGLISSHWEMGLKGFVAGASGSELDHEESRRMCESHMSLRQSKAAKSKLWVQSEVCTKCRFDGRYCCDGSSRQ